MKKIVLVIVILFVTISCSTQKTFYENGALKSIGKISNGEKVGEWKIYWKNGQLRQIGEFKNNKQNGKWIFFHPNGINSGFVTIIDGKRNGKSIAYHTNGEIYTARIWKNDKLISILYCYDGEGNQLNKGTLKNGSGTMNLYDVKGNLIETVIYKNGELVK